MKILRYSALFAMISLILFVPKISFSQGVQTLTECIPTQTHMQFSCKVMITDGTVPVIDREIVVSAMMPSMPMAHNVKPAKLDMTDNIEGQYEFIIELEMLGEWMFSYDLQTPKKLRLMEKIILGLDVTMSNGTHSHGNKVSHK